MPLFKLIKRHSVNILFYDQWDFSTPLFSNPTIWEMFTKQHGPHRQGIGLFVSAIIGYISNWNTRAESYFLGFILILISILALYLKKRLFGHLIAWDLLIPAIILSFTQIEALVLTPNPAHGILPLFLVIICCLILTIENTFRRYLSLLIITFLATYTGFGVFVGLVTPFILLVSLLIFIRNKEQNNARIAGFSFLISLLSFGSFFANYIFSPAVDCFQFPHSKPLEYFSFIGLEFANFVGFTSDYKSIVVLFLGLLLFVILIITVSIQLWQIWKQSKVLSKSLIILFLITFTLLFSINAAIGRVCLGVEAAHASRYMTLLIPAWLGLYFAIKDLSFIKFSLLANMGLVLLFVLLPSLNFEKFNNSMEFYSYAKRKWASCYIENESIENCDRIAGHPIYPSPKATDLEQKLQLLKQNHFNLFIEK